MASSSESVFTDLDEYVTLRSNDGVVTVEVTAAGFRQPPDEIARLLVELGEGLPRPGAEDEAALASGIDALDQLQRAATTGGYDGFTAAMRLRLGIEGPVAPLGPDPELDRAIAGRLDGILTTMRGAAETRGEPREVLTAEARSDEGDLAVTTSSERIIADVRIEPEARARGLEGLGEALSALIARARERLRELGERHARETTPEDVAERIDTAGEDAERAGRSAATMLDRIAQMNESIQRKAGGR